MKVLVDTNVILDIALNREPFVEHAVRFFKEAQQHSIQLVMTATTITDLYYITSKAKGRETALSFIDDLLCFFDVASVDKEVIMRALQSDMSDFEDAVQAYSAQQKNISIIITRNEKDLLESGLEVHTPETFLQKIQS
ncbi:MAG: type II toxin-antitoxin system VapC family toxin [Candidatus Electrothrix sp. YB6]